jgi:hypothetical protein
MRCVASQLFLIYKFINEYETSHPKQNSCNASGSNKKLNSYLESITPFEAACFCITSKIVSLNDAAVWLFDFSFSART